MCKLSDDAREALEAALPYLDNSDSPGGCNGKHKDCPHCLAIAKVRKALAAIPREQEEKPLGRSPTGPYYVGALAKYLYENCGLNPPQHQQIAAEILSDYDVWLLSSISGSAHQPEEITKAEMDAIEAAAIAGKPLSGSTHQPQGGDAREALLKLIAGAYNEGFGEGIREHTSSKGGWPWHSRKQKYGALLDKALAPVRAAAEHHYPEGANVDRTDKPVRVKATAEPGEMREALNDLVALPVEAINSLEFHQRQLDMDGVEVGVSRQAVDEIVAAVKKVRAAAEPGEIREPADDELAAWARNWHWQDCAEDIPVDPSIYFRDMRMLKAYIAKCRRRPLPGQRQ